MLLEILTYQCVTSVLVALIHRNKAGPLPSVWLTFTVNNLGGFSLDLLTTGKC